MTKISDLSVGLADAVEAAAGHVVSVRAARPISGTVIGDDLVLTVAHVLHTDEVTVITPDGRTLAAVVAGRDPHSDLALLKVDGLRMPPLSASAGVRVGELLFAVGRPPHGHQATLGLMERAGAHRGWLASGAAPFRGSSGGALVDARGGLVGVLNAGVSRGSLLAVPAARALKVAELLNTNGRVPRGFLGLATQPVHLPGPHAQDTQAEASTAATGTATAAGERGAQQAKPGQGAEDRGMTPRGWGAGRGPRGRGGHEHNGHEHDGHGRGWGERGWGERARGGAGRGPWREQRQGGRFGLTVVQVEDGSPAAAAGLRLGDILLALDGEGIRHPRELLGRVHDRAGETLALRVLRGGEEQDVTVTIGER